MGLGAEGQGSVIASQWAGQAFARRDALCVSPFFRCAHSQYWGRVAKSALRPKRPLVQFLGLGSKLR